MEKDEEEGSDQHANAEVKRAAGQLVQVPTPRNLDRFLKRQEIMATAPRERPVTLDLPDLSTRQNCREAKHSQSLWKPESRERFGSGSRNILTVDSCVDQIYRVSDVLLLQPNKAGSSKGMGISPGKFCTSSLP